MKVVFLDVFIFYFDDDDDDGSHSSSSSNGCSQHLNNAFIIQMIPGACNFVLTQKLFSFNYFSFLFFLIQILCFMGWKHLLSERLRQNWVVICDFRKTDFSFFPFQPSRSSRWTHTAGHTHRDPGTKRILLSACLLDSLMVTQPRWPPASGGGAAG